jgi:hypothetical protein
VIVKAEVEVVGGGGGGRGLLRNRLAVNKHTLTTPTRLEVSKLLLLECNAQRRHIPSFLSTLGK